MSYEVLEEGKALRCGQCGVVTRMPEDVESRWCRCCGMGHDEYERRELDLFRPKEPFKAGETVERAGRRFEVLEDLGLYGSVLDGEGAKWFPFFWFHEGEWCRRVL